MERKICGEALALLQYMQCLALNRENDPVIIPNNFFSIFHSADVNKAQLRIFNFQSSKLQQQNKGSKIILYPSCFTSNQIVVTGQQHKFVLFVTS